MNPAQLDALIKHGYYVDANGLSYLDRQRRLITMTLVTVDDVNVIPQWPLCAQEQIRPDVVIAVRFALASLPEQSRMLEVPGSRYDGIPWRAKPVVLPTWENLIWPSLA